MQRNFYTTIKPFVIFVSGMGIVPYCFKNNQLCTSHLHSLYALFLIIIHSTLRYSWLDFDILQLRNTTETSTVIFIVVSVLQITAILINSIVGKKKFMKFSNTMLKCEQAFEEIMHIPQEPLNKTLYVHGALWIFVIMASYVPHITSGEEITMENVVNNLISVYTWILNGCICIYAIVHVLEIRRGFCVLNECLRRMQKGNTWAEFEYEQLLKQKKWNPNVENLAKIGLLHLHLCDCIKKFSNVLGLILVTKTIASFVTVLMQIYVGYICTLYFSAIKPLYSVLIFWCALGVFSYAVSMTTLCQSCSSTINEVKYNLLYLLCLLFGLIQQTP